MRTKTLIILIVVSFIFFILGIVGFMIYGKLTYQPGVKGLSKKNIGIIYCSYNNYSMKDMVDIVAKKLKADVIELKSAAPYPTDEKDFLKRIDNENNDLSKVVLSNGVVDVKKYKLIVFGTPIIQKQPCPAIKKFIQDNHSRLDNKPTSVMVKFKNGEEARQAMEYLYYKLNNTSQKPNILTSTNEKRILDREMQIWFDEMEFTREELR